MPIFAAEMAFDLRPFHVASLSLWRDQDVARPVSLRSLRFALPSAFLTLQPFAP